MILNFKNEIEGLNGKNYIQNGNTEKSINSQTGRQLRSVIKLYNLRNNCK